MGIYNFAPSCTADCNHGFLLTDGVYKSFDYPGATYTAGTGINSLGVIGGAFTDSSGNTHGFIRTPSYRVSDLPIGKFYREVSSSGVR